MNRRPARPAVELRPIPGWEGRYSATSDGHIWSHVRGRIIREEWSNPNRPSHQHLRVRLKLGPDRHWRYVHQLVAEAWLGPRPAGWHTCHRDGDRTHNAPSNLYYGTPADNAADRERHRLERELELDHVEGTYVPDAALGF